MAFADPQSLTIGATTYSLARVESGGRKAIYSSADGLVTLTISHTPQPNGRIRTLVRVDRKAVVTNPLDSSNDYDTYSEWHVWDRPAFGFTQTDAEQQTTGFKTSLTNTVVDQLYGQQS
jgi:hypothetical protein